MSARRQNPPQFDLPVIEAEFNLQVQPGIDGERIARERRQAEADRDDAAKRQPTLEEIFGEPIASYSRRQAIEDGVLVDLTQPETVRAVREAGFKWPVAMTATAFAATICEPEFTMALNSRSRSLVQSASCMTRCSITSGPISCIRSTDCSIA